MKNRRRIAFKEIGQIIIQLDPETQKELERLDRRLTQHEIEQLSCEVCGKRGHREESCRG